MLLEFEPPAENEEAGLAVFMRSDYQYQLAVRRRAQQRVLLLRKRLGDICQEETVAELPDGGVILQVRSDPETYQFVWGRPDGEMHPCGSALTRFLATEVARTWSGLLIGVYASGNGTACAATADFDWFEYKKLVDGDRAGSQEMTQKNVISRPEGGRTHFVREIPVSQPD